MGPSAKIGCPCGQQRGSRLVAYGGCTRLAEFKGEGAFGFDGDSEEEEAEELGIGGEVEGRRSSPGIAGSFTDRVRDFLCGVGR